MCIPLLHLRIVLLHMFQIAVSTAALIKHAAPRTTATQLVHDTPATDAVAPAMHQLIAAVAPCPKNYSGFL